MKELTQVQRFALEMLFRAVGAQPFNGSFEDMLDTIERIPRSVKKVEHMINETLKHYAQTEEFKRREFCRFKPGDTIVHYEKYPTSISRETIRQALVNSGWWPPQEEEPEWFKLLNSGACRRFVDQPI